MPNPDRFTPPPSKPGTLDIASARFLLTSEPMHAKLFELVQQNCFRSIFIDQTEIHPSAIVRIMLRSLLNIYNTWRVKKILSPLELSYYDQNLTKFRNMWLSMHWKPTVWVHWLCAHSSYYLEAHRSMYIFSSIPSEYRHQGFKRDLRFTFQGWRVKQPVLMAPSLRKTIHLDALDKGLQLLAIK